MILTIGQYIEALGNSDGRFRTLGKVWPVRDDDGNPVFSMPGHGLADFEVMVGDIRHVLRCPLRSGAEAAERLRTLHAGEKGLGSWFFIEWSLLEKEMVLFDAGGHPVEVDILARVAPHGETAAGFLQKAASTGDTGSIMAALKSFGKLTAWAREAGCSGVVARKLYVAPDGETTVTGFSAHDESPIVALAFAFTVALPSRFADAGLPLISAPASAAARPLAEKLCAAASEAGFPELSEMLAGDVPGAVRKFGGRSAGEISALGTRLSEALGAAEEKPAEGHFGYSWREDEEEGIKCVRDGGGWRYVDRRNRPVIDTVWLSASPFREGRAEVETRTGHGLIDKEGHAVLEPVYEELAWDEYWGIVSVMTEGRWSLLDRDGMLLTGDHYDWLGECCEGLILAQKDGKCGFIDAEGREAVPFLYDDATSFSEGFAFVTSGGENFFINSKGEKI